MSQLVKRQSERNTTRVDSDNHCGMADREIGPQSEDWDCGIVVMPIYTELKGLQKRKKDHGTGNDVRGKAGGSPALLGRLGGQQGGVAAPGRGDQQARGSARPGAAGGNAAGGAG